jgi:excisionase family DNA binding protein
MSNPFESIEARLSNIENLILDLKHPPKQQEKNQDLLTVEEAAGFLSLSVPTIYSKVSKGELPFMKRSKRLYFSKSELLEYVKGGRQQTNAEIESKANLYLKK